MEEATESSVCVLKFQALDLQALCLLDLFYILVPAEQTLN